MRLLFIWVVISTAVAGQVLDPATLMSAEMTIFLEVRDLSAVAELLQRSPLFSEPDGKEESGPSEILEELSSAKIGTFALGISPEALRPHSWVVVLESPEPQAALALIRSWRPEDPVVTMTIPPFLVVTNSQKTLDATMEIAKGEGKPLLRRADFKAFRAAEGGADAPIRFHLDVQQMWPRPFRSRVRNSPNIWSVLLGCHVNHVIKTIGTLSGTVTTRDDGFTVSIHGGIRATESRAVTEGRPAEGVIKAPAGTGFQVSVPRNLTHFWDRREALLPAVTETRLTNLEERVGSVMPEWTVEKLLGQIGEAFDLYISPSDDPSETGQRVPAMALVLASPTPPAPSQVAALRTFFALVNGAFDDSSSIPSDDRPTIQSHRGIELSISKSAAPSVMAIVDRRIVIANQSALAIRLVDSALDTKPSPRSAGDEIVAFGPHAARVIADGKDLFSSGWLEQRAGSKEAARSILDGAERFLLHVQEARIRFDLDGPEVKLEIQAVAPGLLGARTGRTSEK